MECDWGYINGRRIAYRKGDLISCCHCKGILYQAKDDVFFGDNIMAESVMVVDKHQGREPVNGEKIVCYLCGEEGPF